MAAVVSAAALDPARARAWTLVRAVQNWLWLLEDDEDDASPVAAVPEIAHWAYDD
jgi:streptomycin 6-kinase